MPISVINGIGGSGLNSGDGIGGSGVSASSGSAIPLIVVQDTFTNDGASAVNLNAHTPDVDYVGGGWTVTNNDGTTFTGTQTVLPDDYLDWSGQGIARIDAGVAAMTVRSTYANAAISGNRDHTILLRRVDNVNCFAVVSRNDTDDLLIQELSSNVATLRASDISVGSSLWSSVYAQDDGSRISVGVDGSAEKIGYSSADKFGGTEVGYYQDSKFGASTAMWVDEFVVISVADYTQLP